MALIYCAVDENPSNAVGDFYFLKRSHEGGGEDAQYLSVCLLGALMVSFLTSCF